MRLPIIDILKALPVVGPTVAATVEFKERFEALVSAHGPEDQAKLREALEDVIADNDEGHRRLQEKLAAAAGL